MSGVCLSILGKTHPGLDKSAWKSSVIQSGASSNVLVNVQCNLGGCIVTAVTSPLLYGHPLQEKSMERTSPVVHFLATWRDFNDDAKLRNRLQAPRWQQANALRCRGVHGIVPPQVGHPFSSIEGSTVQKIYPNAAFCFAFSPRLFILHVELSLGPS